MLLTGKELLARGFTPGPAIGLLRQAAAVAPVGTVEATLAALGRDPAPYLSDPCWGPAARALLPAATPELAVLRVTPLPYPVFGTAIEAGAFEQMGAAMRLPVAVAGALMPDAHQGYGLPIGGVLACDQAVIPYAVGVDIGCRVQLSILDVANRQPAADWLREHGARLLDLLATHTRFGEQREHERPNDDAVLADPLFNEIPLLRQLQGLAARQFGTSGGGNHFVEFGLVEVYRAAPALGLLPGRYVGLMSHSGSRGLGARVADHYCRLATQQHPLPAPAQHLSWLTLGSDAGQQYWRAMSLAGAYAAAGHRDIHRRLLAALGGAKALATVTNTHNLAWEETHQGRPLIVHRKGATPAGAGVLGIIPGSMATPAFVVRGLGEASSLRSASHGAGRRLSRTQAQQQLSPADLSQALARAGVQLLGGGLDEAPQAYKNIYEVMSDQRALVTPEAVFTPSVVRMAPPEGAKPWQRGKKAAPDA